MINITRGTCDRFYTAAIFMKNTTGKLELFCSWFLVIIAFLGIMDASYITYNELTGHIPPCRPPFACDTVLKSPWSRIGPVPLSAVGMFYYTLVFSVATINFLGIRTIRLPRNNVFHTEDILVLFTTFGVGFSAFLIFLMAVILKAWCVYCVISASFCVFLFGTAIALRQQRLLKRETWYSFRRSAFSLLYQWVFKPIAFCIDAEFMHNSLTGLGQMLGSFPLTRKLTQEVFLYTHPNLGKTLDGIYFPNPVGLSAGFDYDGKLTDILPAVGFGFSTVGTITHEPYEGNTKPRLGRFPRSKGLLVNKGFKNEGAEAVIKRLEGKNFSIPIGISIGSTNKIHESSTAQITDIIETFKLFERSHLAHAYYELNISCPNTKGGQPFTTPSLLTPLLKRVDSLSVKKPIYIKMPIDLSPKDTLALLTIAQKHRIAGVIFGNLTKDKNNPDVDPQDREQWKVKAGNISGKPTWNRSNALIALTKKHFKNRFTIIGTGGIFTPQDAQMKLNLGADLVQLITGMIYEGPQLIGAICEHVASHKTVSKPIKKSQKR